MPIVGLLGIQEIYIFGLLGIQEIDIRSFRGLRCIDTIFILTIFINGVVINYN